MRFRSVTLGCKVNQFETQAVESILVSRGHTQAKPGEGCDVYIINTCLVTAESARKSRQAVRRAVRLEPGAKIAVCGCFSQLEPETAGLLGADLIGGTGDKTAFALAVEKLGNSNRDGAGRGEVPSVPSGQTVCPPLLISPVPAYESPLCDVPPGAAAGRTRALLKIQDGCDNHCSYCIVPHARGRSRSLPLKTVYEHARLLDSKGFREIVITGIEISSYGRDLDDNPVLADAVRAVSEAAPGARLRLGSLDPGAVTENFCLHLEKTGNLCGHFHLSLQSGCDETLRRMGRKYSSGDVLDAIERLRNGFPGCGITADLIVGFPGETKAEFETTLAFIQNAAFSGMHVFTYSQRPGTPAADMQGQVDKAVRRDRASSAAAISKSMAEDFKLGQVGATRNVLFEKKSGGFWMGRTDNYIEVAIKKGGSRNTVLPVRITSVENGMVWGEVG